MESLCPNCQKLITVPEQYAGQQMKCPLCQQTFQAPSLASSAVAAPFSPPAPPPEVYKFTPPPSSPPKSSRAASAPSPGFDQAKPTPADSPAPAGYGRKFTLQLSSGVLPWIPAACFFLIFVLTFFSWVGMYPGGIGVVTQNAWQAAFGYYSIDGAYEEMSVEDGKKFNADKDAPGFSIIAFFYILAFLPIMVVTIAVAVVSVLKINLPPQVQNFWAWRYLAVGALTLIPLFFLFLQSMFGFPLENKAQANIDQQFKDDRTAAGSNPIKISKVDITEGVALATRALSRTRARSFVILFHLIATIGALLAFWLERRGPNRPLPRFEMLW
jgi:hypothetical protein